MIRTKHRFKNNTIFQARDSTTFFLKTNAQQLNDGSKKNPITSQRGYVNIRILINLLKAIYSFAHSTQSFE